MQQEARHRWASSINKTLPTTTITETLEPFSYQNFNNNNTTTTTTNSSSSFFLPLTIMSNGRDRTSEFQTTVKKFASKRVRKKSMELKDLFIGILEWS
jgi:hypothetical protein